MANSKRKAEEENSEVNVAEETAPETGNENSGSGNSSSLEKENAALRKKVENQAALIKDLKEELNQSNKAAASGKKLVKDSSGKNHEFITGKYNARLEEGGDLITITADYLSTNPEAVDKLLVMKVGFLK